MFNSLEVHTPNNPIPILSSSESPNLSHPTKQNAPDSNNDPLDLTRYFPPIASPKVEQFVPVNEIVTTNQVVLENNIPTIYLAEPQLQLEIDNKGMDLPNPLLHLLKEAGIVNLEKISKKYLQQINWLNSVLHRFDTFGEKPKRWNEKIAFRGTLALNWIIEKTNLISPEHKEQINKNKERMSQLKYESFFRTGMRFFEGEDETNMQFNSHIPQILDLLGLKGDIDTFFLEGAEIPPGLDQRKDVMRLTKSRREEKLFFLKDMYQSDRQFDGSTGPTIEIVNEANLFKTRGSLLRTSLMFKKGIVKIFNLPRIINGQFIQDLNLDDKNGFNSTSESINSLTDMAKAIFYATYNSAKLGEIPKDLPKDSLRNTLSNLNTETEGLATKTSNERSYSKTEAYKNEIKTLEKNSKNAMVLLIVLYKSLYLNPTKILQTMHQLNMINVEDINRIGNIFENPNSSYENRFVQFLDQLLGNEISEQLMTNLDYLYPCALTQMLILQKTNLGKKDQNGNIIIVENTNPYLENAKEYTPAIDEEELRPYKRRVTAQMKSLPFPDKDYFDRLSDHSYIIKYNSKKQ